MLPKPLACHRARPLLFPNDTIHDTHTHTPQKHTLSLQRLIKKGHWRLKVHKNDHTHRPPWCRRPRRQALRRPPPRRRPGPPPRRSRRVGALDSSPWWRPHQARKGALVTEGEVFDGVFRRVVGAFRGFGVSVCFSPLTLGDENSRRSVFFFCQICGQSHRRRGVSKGKELLPGGNGPRSWTEPLRKKPTFPSVERWSNHSSNHINKLRLLRFPGPTQSRMLDGLLVHFNPKPAFTRQAGSPVELRSEQKQGDHG